MENDESASHQSLEKTASTVEIASTTIERTTSKAVPSATGRTAWDALVDMGGMLGPYTPWIIIVAGLFFGTYKFMDMQQAARKDAQDASRKEVDQAHAALLSTYEQIGNMHKQQLEGLSSMLKLNKETAESTQDQTSRLNKLKEDTRNTEEEAKAAKEAADKAKVAALAAERQRIGAQHLLEEANRQLVTASQASQKNQDDLEQKQKKFGEQGDEKKALRERLTAVAKLLVDSTDSSVSTLGREILKEFPSFDAKTLLAAYAKQPAKNTAAALKEFLGSSGESLEATLREPLGFAFWQKYSMKDGSKTAYVGVIRQTHDSDEDVVLITVTGKKVEDIDVFPQIVSIALWDPDDWNKSVAYNVYVRPNGDAGMDRFTIKNDRWTIPDTETDFLDQGPPEKLFGVEEPLFFMKLEDFKKQTEIFKAVKDSKRDDFLNMVAMLENEKGFDAKKAVEPFIAPMPKGVRETFIQLLTESVKHPPGTSVAIASSPNLKPDVYGRVGAVALKTGFRIEDAGTSPASSVTEGETYFILCEYRVGEKARNARLTFTRNGPDGKWMLLSFENPFVLRPLAKAD